MATSETEIYLIPPKILLLDLLLQSILTGGPSTLVNLLLTCVHTYLC